MATPMSPVDNATLQEESLTPLEQEVLDEYAKLAGNLGDVSYVCFYLFLLSCPLVRGRY